MRFGDLLGASLASLWQRKFRTSLTVLGVVIGTMAVVVMVSLGVGLAQAQYDQIEQYGSLRQIDVYSPPMNNQDPFAPEQKMDAAFEKNLSELPGVEAVWPRYEVMAEVRVAGYQSQLNITGVPIGMLESLNLPFASGGLPPANSPLAFVFGDKVSDAYFYDEATQAPAKIDFMQAQMFVNFTSDGGFGPGMPGVPSEPSDPGQPSDPGTKAPPKRFLIPAAGVIAGEPDTWGPHASMVYADIESLISTMEKAFPGKALPGQPATSTGRPMGPFIYQMFTVRTTDLKAAEDLTTFMKEQGYGFSSPMEWRQQIEQQSMLIQAVFGGIGFISLLVAAIGIANTMLMSVYERTREIGIMKVLGAALTDIRNMFLLESASIGFFGGLFGLGLSLLVSTVLNATLGGALDMGTGPTRISLVPVWLMLGAIGFSTLIGTVAGLVPARRAMRLSALAAIRSQ